MTESASIPLTAVRDVLWLAVVQRKRPHDHLARFAAFTRYPSALAPRCGSTTRVWAEPMHVGPMEPGDTWRLLSKHRSAAGLTGVRRTWGAGMRELQAEFAQGAMR